MPTKFTKFLGRLKAGLSSLLKNKALKPILIKIFGSSLMGGVLGWIITFVADNLYEKMVEPFIKRIFNELGFQYDRAQGKKLVNKMIKAKKEGNLEDYNDAVDDVFTS